MTIRSSTPQALSQMIKTDTARFTELFQKAGIARSNPALDNSIPDNPRATTAGGHKAPAVF